MTLVFNNDEALGIVRSEEIQSGKQRSTAFAGTRSGNEFAVSFIRGEPPITDDVSDWANKKWILKKVSGKDVLQIIFHKKNYVGSNGSDTLKNFELTICE